MKLGPERDRLYAEYKKLRTQTNGAIQRAKRGTRCERANKIADFEYTDTKKFWNAVKKNGGLTTNEGQQDIERVIDPNQVRL